MRETIVEALSDVNGREKRPHRTIPRKLRGRGVVCRRQSGKRRNRKSGWVEREKLLVALTKKAFQARMVKLGGIYSLTESPT